MSGVPARLRSVERAALVVLCLILAASVSMRFYSHKRVSEAADHADDTIDLGAGVSLPRARAVSQTLRLASCSAPATIYFVPPALYGVGAALNAPPDRNDRVFYAYQGNTLSGRFAAMKLSMIYVARLASGLLTISRQNAVDDLAAKIIVPAECDATPAEALVAFRRKVQAQ